MNVPVKRGMMLRHQDHLWYVDDVSERHTGKQRPTVHVSLREAVGTRHIERTLDELGTIDEVPSGYRPVQYLYARGEARVFMDMETFEEFELSGSALQGAEMSLKEGEEMRALFAEDRPLLLDVPEAVVLKIADTAAPTHAVGSAGSVLKEAFLENGVQVKVPLFIKTGDAVRIKTRTLEYLGKA
jgi:elongation factor P